jgi:N-acyl-L-homoserine lactone synthetase
MTDVVRANNRGYFSKQIDSMFEDRKRVFVDLLRWDLPVSDSRLELDQFDDEYAVYLIISDSTGNHMGSVRLLRADRPHILGDLFPYLCARSVPADSSTMEITRLCLSPELPAAQRLHIRNRLISAMVDYALAEGVNAFSGVVTARFLSQILMMGWRCRSLGTPRMVNGSTIGAFRIDIDPATPRMLQATGIYVPGEINEHTDIAN